MGMSLRRQFAMRLLDLFCGAGGAAMGYHRAGFDEIVGVDHVEQPRYPFDFVQADALEYVAEHGREFDVIHASPPCQRYSVATAIHGRGRVEEHPDLVAQTRFLLDETKLHYVIENVPGAPLANPLMLCGSMFGLRVLRHRLFECRPPIIFAPASCNHWATLPPSKGVYHTLDQYDMITCVGHNFSAESGRIAMDISWMTRDELAEAIPPAYTEYVGRQLLRVLR